MAKRLLYATAWRDLRWPALATAIAVVAFAIGVASSFGLATLALRQGDTGGWAQLARLPNPYRTYVDWVWFRVPGTSFVLAIAAAFMAARVPLRRRADTPFMLLLPVTRTEILVTRFVVLAGLLLALCLAVSAVMVIAGAVLFDRPYPLGRAILAAILAFTGALAWAGVTVALASFVNRAVAVGLVLAAMYFVPFNQFQMTLPPRANIDPAGAWNMWAVTDPSLWSATVPWLALLISVVLAVGGPLLAAHRLARVDF
jgi:hypothetical protein